MIQTLVTQAVLAPAHAPDKVPLTGAVEGAPGEGGEVAEPLGDFASLIALAQRGEPLQADEVDATEALGESEAANLLASEDASKGQPEADVGCEEAAPGDFLLRLQDSLKLDTSLVSVPLAPAPGFVVFAEAVTDGKPLPPDEEGTNGAASLATGAQLAGWPSASQSARSRAAAPMSSTQGDPWSGSQPLPLAASQDEQVKRGTGSVDLTALPLSGEERQGDRPGAETTEQHGGEGVDEKPSSDAERLVRLARVSQALVAEHGTKEVVTARQIAGAELAVTPSSDRGEQARQPEATLSGKESGKDNSGKESGKGSAVPSATPPTPGAPLKAFYEGVKVADPSLQGVSREASAEPQQGALSRATDEGEAKREGSAAPTTAPTSAGHAVTPATAQSQSTAPEAVLVAPPQILAQAESRGPQAPLSPLSAGIKQMEVRGAAESRKGTAIESRQKAGSEKLVFASEAASEHSQSQQVQHSQPQVQSVESRPAASAEGALRRDPQGLPHLKLAHPEAPAELHQRVNVMLADKLQQAEIQLDPIGLGKMKIQIQIDSTSQASVHFVVQHGQTREMLEQAMPRLREMLAGQGIQLGQTQVQQQSPQSQQQGQSAFAGQGQQGQGGSQSQAARGQPEGDLATSAQGLPAGSTNGAGIDFYA